MFLQNSGLENIQYNAKGHDTIYPVIISGVISGFVYGICFKNNASTGDIAFLKNLRSCGDKELLIGEIVKLLSDKDYTIVNVEGAASKIEKLVIYALHYKYVIVNKFFDKRCFK